MRSRLIAGCAVAALALGAQASSATAKPVLWLKQFTMEHAEPGTAANVSIGIGGPCASDQSASLASNGEATDGFTLAATSPVVECGAGKLAATVTSLVAKPSGDQEMTLTAKGAIHVLIDPWCVYTLPKTITLPGRGATFGESSLTGTLDKAATFGSCASSRAFGVTVTVRETFSALPFNAEVTG
jgi:hypothetical protein